MASNAPRNSPDDCGSTRDGSDADFLPGADLLDCFNDDLVWIVDRLVARIGGSFGIVSRHIQGDLVAGILARTSKIPAEPDSFFYALAQTASSVIGGERRRHNDVPDMRQASYTTAIAQSSAVFHVLRLVFAPSSRVALVVSVCRPGGEQAFNEPEMLTAATLYPVLSRYVRLWWLHRTERQRSNALSSALDLSDIGVLLLDRCADLLFANSHATLLLDQADGLRRCAHSIVAADPREGFKFQAAIQHALHRNVGHGTTARTLSTLSLQRESPKRALLAAVMNVERPAVDRHDPAVMIYLFDPEQNVDEMLAPVCRMYELTGSEARLVRHLVAGLRIVEAATRMQVRPDTARTYLKQIFLKTRTNRQVDLVRLMLVSLLRTHRPDALPLGCPANQE